MIENECIENERRKSEISRGTGEINESIYLYRFLTVAICVQLNSDSDDKTHTARDGCTGPEGTF